MESSTLEGKNRVSADGARSTAISSKSDRVTEVIPAIGYTESATTEGGQRDGVQGRVNRSRR